MPDSFNALMASREQRYANQLDHSIRMMSGIVRERDGAIDRGNSFLANLMLDAFYVHVRLLADFLVRPHQPTKDFGPSEFGIVWEKPSTDEATRLDEYWDRASKYVVHFSHLRVPELIDDLAPFEVSTAAFRTMGADAMRVFAVFLRKLEAVTPVWTGGSRVPDMEGQREEWEARNLWDRTAMLRRSFEEACGVFGLDAEELLAPEVRLFSS